MILPAHFDLDNATAYAAWREAKLAAHPRRLEDLLVEVADPRRLTFAEREALLARCGVANMALYASTTGNDPDKDIPRLLGRQIGLVSLDANRLADDDGISPLAVAPAGTRTEFIPYTDRGIKWHTDGYYNTLDRQVRGLLLHCVQSAESGGENRLMDHEIAYILLRDENPDYIRALMAPDAMTIPPRLEEGEVARAAQPGPVFSVYPDGHLHMRYTARTVSIEWHDDPATKGAVAALERLLADADTPYVFRGRLEPGMGLVCNNVLHDRAAFSDSETRKRLLYRARYFDRITDAPYSAD
ncbi:MAG: taurine catabolism dioxygenase TauD [Rhodocyclales bacterium]|nr:MAG: taurine catabolism dioxygenase TauD [Rhodocyclales bacterium]